jgi:shikimate kinase
VDASQAVVVIGMPGAGKTAVGAALARLLQWAFVDIDDVVAADVGDVPTFIEREGIETFRSRERTAIDAVTTAIRNGATPATVLSVGGGAVLDASNRDALRAAGPIVWLRATLPTLLDHVGDGEGRPLLEGGAEAALARLLEERTPTYDAMATITIDVDGLDPNEAAVATVKELSAA